MLTALAGGAARSIERDIDRTIARLQHLARDDALQGDDRAAARDLLQMGLGGQPTWQRFDLLAADGRLLIDAGPDAPGSAAIDPSASTGAAALAAALRRGEPAAAQLLTTAEGHGPVAAIAVPVAQPGAAPRALAVSIDAEAWRALLDIGGLPPGAAAVLCDGAGHSIVRSLAPPFTDPCGVPAEGSRYAVWQPLARFGWRVGVGVPTEAIDAAQRQAVLLAIGTAAACLLLAVAGAGLVARQIAEPLRRLALPTTDDAATQPIAVDELALLRDALASATALQRAAAERVETKAQEFEALFREGPLGLAFAQDPACRSVLCNAAMERLMPHALAWSDDERPDLSTAQVLFAGAPLPAPERPLRRAAISGLSVEAVELELRLPDAAPRFVLASAVALLDAEQQPRGAIGAVVDITAQRNAERRHAEVVQREQRARQDAEVASRAKDEFLGMLGHELRNPLNAIATAVEVLNRTEASTPVAVSARGIIGNQTRQLARMMDALLDVGRVIADDVQLMRQPLDFAALVQRVIDGAEADARRKDLSLGRAIMPAWVHGDLQRLQQVVEQLTSNAVKYTQEGGRIDFQLTLEGTDAVLRVRDNGCGIEPELREHVFEPFVQGARSLARPGGGLGIGLALVKRLVELHEGSVAVDSSEAGSEFTVRIPAIDAPTDIGGVAGRVKSIVVVDDNADALYALRSTLGIEGHRVRSASDGLEGLAVLLQVAPDVAIVDIGLPGIDGYELARRSRAGGFRGLLVAVTGYGQQRDAQSSIAAGFDAHLVKPVDVDALLALVARA
jgi:signal transduction histidine kinase